MSNLLKVASIPELYTIILDRLPIKTRLLLRQLSEVTNKYDYALELEYQKYIIRLKIPIDAITIKNGSEFLDPAIVCEMGSIPLIKFLHPKGISYEGLLWKAARYGNLDFVKHIIVTYLDGGKDMKFMPDNLSYLISKGDLETFMFLVDICCKYKKPFAYRRLHIELAVGPHYERGEYDNLNYIDLFIYATKAHSEKFVCELFRYARKLVHQGYTRDIYAEMLCCYVQVSTITDPQAMATNLLALYKLVRPDAALQNVFNAIVTHRKYGKLVGGMLQTNRAAIGVWLAINTKITLPRCYYFHNISKILLNSTLEQSKNLLLRSYTVYHFEDFMRKEMPEDHYLYNLETIKWLYQQAGIAMNSDRVNTKNAVTNYEQMYGLAYNCVYGTMDLVKWVVETLLAAGTYRRYAGPLYVRACSILNRPAAELIYKHTENFCDLISDADAIKIITGAIRSGNRRMCDMVWEHTRNFIKYGNFTTKGILKGQPSVVEQAIAERNTVGLEWILEKCTSKPVVHPNSITPLLSSGDAETLESIINLVWKNRIKALIRYWLTNIGPYSLTVLQILDRIIPSTRKKIKKVIDNTVHTIPINPTLLQLLRGGEPLCSVAVTNVAKWIKDNCYAEDLTVENGTI